MSLVQRFDHVGITVDDLDAVTSFFLKLGLEQEGESQIVEGDWLDTVIGIDDARVEVVMLQTPGGGTRLELSKFHEPVDERGSEAAPTSSDCATSPSQWTISTRPADRLKADGFGLVGAVA